MNGKQLKNSILQWAIQGKLVPQDPNDEPASVLLDKIRQEKERLIKEKKIKRDKNASIIYRGEDNSYYEKILATGEVKCIDEEIPFEIPKGWEWCKINNIAFVTKLAGFEYTKYIAGNLKTNGIPLFKGKNVQGGKIIYEFEAYIPESLSDELERSQISKKCLLTPYVGTIGNIGLHNKSGKFHLGSNVGKIEILNPASQVCILEEFVHIYLLSQYGFAELTKYKKATAQESISIEAIRDVLLPIPPTQEQQKIVDKYYQIETFADKFSKLQGCLDKLNTEIFGRFKKSVLQEAIQGKLVPQIASEGTAHELLEQIKIEKQKLVKEGKLKKSALNDSVIFKGDDNKYWEKSEDGAVCIDEEIPFDIPVNWAWVRLDDICSFIHRGKSPKYSLIKKYPVVAQKCNQWSGFSIEKAKFIEPQSISSYKEEYILQDEDLMWNSTGLGTLGRMAIYYKRLNPYELAVVDSHVTVIRPYKQYVVSEYLYYYFASNTVQSVIEDKSDGSTKQKELSTKTVKSYLVPLPPMEEQKRIVEKVEKLMQLLK